MIFKDRIRLARKIAGDEMKPGIAIGLVKLFQNTGILGDLNRYAVNAKIICQKGRALAGGWDLSR